MKSKLILIMRVTAAIILLQTLFFKFTGAPESIYIFSQLGAEPFGRWLSGVLELVTGILLLFPTTSSLGALLGLGIMACAILSHFFVLGIQVQNDGGLLFILALIVTACCSLILFFEREQFKSWVQRIKKA